MGCKHEACGESWGPNGRLALRLSRDAQIGGSEKEEGAGERRGEQKPFFCMKLDKLDWA